MLVDGFSILTSIFFQSKNNFENAEIVLKYLMTVEFDSLFTYFTKSTVYFVIFIKEDIFEIGIDTDQNKYYYWHEVKNNIKDQEFNNLDALLEVFNDERFVGDNEKHNAV